MAGKDNRYATEDNELQTTTPVNSNKDETSRKSNYAFQLKCLKAFLAMAFTATVFVALFAFPYVSPILAAVGFIGLLCLLPWGSSRRVGYCTETYVEPSCGVNIVPVYAHRQIQRPFCTPLPQATVYNSRGIFGAPQATVSHSRGGFGAPQATVSHPRGGFGAPHAPAPHSRGGFGSHNH